MADNQGTGPRRGDGSGFSRRAFCLMGVGAAATALSGCMESRLAFPSSFDGLPSVTFGYRPVPQLGSPSAEPFRVPPVNMNRIPREFHRQYVDHGGRFEPGTLIVDTAGRHLYLIVNETTAIRYGIGVGRAGFAWGGEAKIGRKSDWPTWTPPSEMIGRDPTLAEWAGGMPGGPGNPLGARAMYLYSGGRDTLYRLHGTNEPLSIGQAMSSGCIRMLNTDVIDLYERVPVGTRVVIVHGQAASV